MNDNHGSIGGIVEHKTTIRGSMRSKTEDGDHEGEGLQHRVKALGLSDEAFATEVKRITGYTAISGSTVRNWYKRHTLRYDARINVNRALTILEARSRGEDPESIPLRKVAEPVPVSSIPKPSSIPADLTAAQKAIEVDILASLEKILLRPELRPHGERRLYIMRTISQMTPKQRSLLRIVAEMIVTGDFSWEDLP